MANFCRQCSLEIMGEDFGDFKGETPVIVYMMGGAALVICEGCGVIQVDPLGNCISKDCEAQHGRAKEAKDRGD